MSFPSAVPQKVKAPQALEPVLRLVWVEHGYHDAPEGAPVTDYERAREFAHLGGAIAWARRRIFRGEVYGDTVELQRVHRVMEDTVVTVDFVEAKELSLKGFQTWSESTYFEQGRGLRMAAPTKRCVWED